jgi:hypothetical protein
VSTNQVQQKLSRSTQNWWGGHWWTQCPAAEFCSLKKSRGDGKFHVIIYLSHILHWLFQALTFILYTRSLNWQIVEINPLKGSCLCSTYKYFCFSVKNKYQTTSICTMRLETVYKIYPRSCHLNGNSYSTPHAYLYIIT